MHVEIVRCNERRKKGGHDYGRLPVKRLSLEVETDLRGQCPRCDVMRPAEGGKEVVEGVFVRYVDGDQLQTDLVFIAAEHVVVAESDIEKTPSGNARWILVVVLRVRLRHV